jgi:hypothetical protein
MTVEIIEPERSRSPEEFPKGRLNFFSLQTVRLCRGDRVQSITRMFRPIFRLVTSHIPLWVRRLTDDFDKSLLRVEDISRWQT